MSASSAKAPVRALSLSEVKTQMGVHIPVLDFLLKFRGRGLGETLLLGRQGLHISMDRSSEEYTAADRVLKSYDPNGQLDALRDDHGWSEPLFRYLGATSVTAMDASAYEGAQIVHDLNQSVPSELYNRFDCIFDGGTIEHIYDVPAVFRNVSSMLRVNGLFLTVNGANNFLGHGFYQFSPELLWRAFSADTGFQVELMQLVDESRTPHPINCDDPQVVGKRQEIRVTEGCTLLLMAATKLRDQPPNNAVQQSDYQTAWVNSSVEPPK